MPASARWSSSASPIVDRRAPASRRRRCASAASKSAASRSGPSRDSAGWSASARGLEQLDHRRVEADGDGARDLEDEPRPRRRPAPALAGPVAMPRAVHPQVGPELEAAVEPDQQVLALRLDARRSVCADDAVGPAARAGARRARRDVAARRGTAAAPRRSERACRLQASGDQRRRRARTADQPAIAPRHEARTRAGAPRQVADGDSPTGSPSTLPMTSSRTRPSATSVAQRRAARPPRRPGRRTPAASGATMPPRSRYSAARRRRARRRRPAARWKGPPIVVAAARPGEGGAVRVRRIGGGEQVHRRGARPARSAGSRTARSRSSAPASANCAAPSPSTK